ncbi:MAG: thermonuclease family protein [Planctomycetota bacterium]|nr:thermonuclease family protein [Planctomycetota bacterium]
MRVLLFLFLLCGCVSVPSERVKRRTVTWFAVEKVIDGCTLRMQGVGRVRYRGVVVPVEGILRPGRIAEEAEDFNKKMVEGRLVRCEPEVPGVVPEGDVHFADVFVRISDTQEILAAAELLRAGLAVLSADYKRSFYAEILEESEREAKELKRGIWSGKP